MTTTLTETQLSNAVDDIEFISAVATSEDSTVVNRLGATRKTVKQVIADLLATAPAKSYATEVALLADLVPVNGVLAYAVDTNKFYVKNGATGVGTWNASTNQQVADLQQAALGVNMWPDEFFRVSGNNLTATANGKRLYNVAHLNATWQADVKHPYGIGAWRHAASALLFGFNLDLAHPGPIEAQLAVGDVVSIGIMVQASAANKGLRAAYRFYNGTETNYTTAEVSTGTINSTGGVQILKLENITWPAGSTGVEVYTFGAGTLGQFDILDIWFVRAAAAGNLPPARRNSGVSEQMIRKTSIGPVLSAVGDIEYNRTIISSAVEVIDKAAVSPSSPATRDDGFSGWADTYALPVSAAWDGVRLYSLNRSSTSTKLWGLVRVVVKTDAANAATGGAVLAVGWTYVDPSQSPLSGVVVLFRDPVTLALKRITQADMLADTLVGYYCETLDGNAAACSEITGSTSGLTHRQSYYHTPTNGDPLGTGWNTFSGNPTLGLEMLTLTTPSSVQQTTPRADWVTKSATALKASGLLPPRPNRLYGSRLTQFRTFMTNFALAANVAQSRFGFGMLGDSWTFSSVYYLQLFARLMIARYGDGGVGWCGAGFSSGTAVSNNGSGADARNLYGRTYTSGWTCNYRAGSTSPDCSDIRSSTAGNIFHLSNVNHATHPALNNPHLHYTGTADGVLAWSWNGGGYSADTPVQGGVGVQQALLLTGAPGGALADAAASTITLDVKVVAGSVTLGGIDLSSNTNGVYFHKLGSSGATAASFASNDATQWKAGYALLNPQATQLLFSTNEEAASQAPATYASNMQTLATRARQACPLTDILFATAPENMDGRAIGMAQYAAAIAAAIDDYRAAACDLQQAFGRATAPAEYGPASAYPLIGASGNPHPDVTLNRGPLALATELDLMWRVG